MVKMIKAQYAVQKSNYHGFDHARVNEHFEGGLTFLNDICVKGEYTPVAVYKVTKPNRKKGHKRYMLLQTSNDPITGKRNGGIVRGMTQAQIDKERYQDAIACNNCKQVIRSVNRHDWHPCACKSKTKSVFIDGGKDYTRIGFGKNASYQNVKLDLLTDTFEVLRKSTKRVR